MSRSLGASASIGSARDPSQKAFSRLTLTVGLHMSLWRHAENCLRNQKIWKELNAFISHGRSEESFLKAVQGAESTRHNGMTPAAAPALMQL
jgi:hypothetical protein